MSIPSQEKPPPESALLVAVPSAENTVETFRRKLDPSSALGMPAHITVLYPFAPLSTISPSVADELGALLRRFEPFDFVLSEVGWFDERVLYLAPSPQAPFVELTVAISEAFPAYLPYGGAFGEVVPHLTVGEGARPIRMRRAPGASRGVCPSRRLPPSSVSWPLTPAGHWSVRRTFPLGRAAPVASDGSRGAPSRCGGPTMPGTPAQACTGNNSL